MRGSPELPTSDLGENRIEKRFPHRFCRNTHFSRLQVTFQFARPCAFSCCFKLIP